MLTLVPVMKSSELRREIVRLPVDGHLGPVGLGVHRQFDVVGILLGAWPGVNDHRLAGGDQPVHARCADADALLTAAHFQPMELTAEQQPAEDILHLFADDAGPIVDHSHAVTGRFGCRGSVGQEIFDNHRQIRQHSRVLAGVQRVVDRFLYSGQQRFARVVEAEQMAVFREKLGNRDVLLLPRHRLGRLAHPAIFG
jgi:hypothetical protein